MISSLLGGQVVKVLLAGRPTLFRHGLRVILLSNLPAWRLEEVDSLPALLDAAAEDGPDLVLLDEQLPGANAPDGLYRLRAQMPHPRLLVLGDTQDRDHVLAVINAGAQGYLLKSADQPQVLAAFNTLLCGGVFAPALLTEPVMRHGAQHDDAHRAIAAGSGLTGRQKDVFDLMAQGCSTKQIARELGLAIGTVKVHLAAIYRALGAHNRMEAVARGGVAGWAPLRPGAAEPAIRSAKTYAL